MELIDQRDFPASSDGIGFSVRIVMDEDSSPYDVADGDSDRVMLAAWGDTWWYVGVIVTPVVDGVELPMCAGDLWGVEYGSCEQWSRPVDTDVIVGEYPVPNMLAECRHQVRKLADRLARLVRA